MEGSAFVAEQKFFFLDNLNLSKSYESNCIYYFPR